MGTVDILEQVVVWTNVSAVVVMVVAFVTTAFVVVVMIIRHMCEPEVLTRCLAAVNVLITKTGSNGTDINKQQSLACTLPSPWLARQIDRKHI